MLVSFHITESNQLFGFVSLQNAADLSVFLNWTGGWGYKIRTWCPLLLTFLFCTAAGQEPPVRWSFYPPQGFCNSNYWDPHEKMLTRCGKSQSWSLPRVGEGTSFIQYFLSWGVLKVYRGMRAKPELNVEFLFRELHNMRPMGHSLKLVESSQNRE